MGLLWDERRGESVQTLQNHEDLAVHKFCASEKKFEKSHKDFEKIKISTAQKILSERKEKSNRFQMGYNSVKRVRSDYERSLNGKYNEIEKRNVIRSKQKSAEKEFNAEVSSIKAEDNIYNKATVKYQLDCIKERIWRKNRRVEVRRARQLQQLAPPTTFEIYMANNKQFMCSQERERVAKNMAKIVTPLPRGKQTSHLVNFRSPLVGIAAEEAVKLACSQAFKKPVVKKDDKPKAK